MNIEPSLYSMCEVLVCLSDNAWNCAQSWPIHDILDHLSPGNIIFPVSGFHAYSSGGSFAEEQTPLSNPGTSHHSIRLV